MAEKYFIVTEKGKNKDKYFPEQLINTLKESGTVEFNPLPGEITEDELCRIAPDATILLTHWGSPQITKKYLSANPDLKMIAHCAGTVAHIASEDTFNAGIPCISANSVMARYVAEAVLGLIISSMRSFKENDLLMQKGIFTKERPADSLFDSSVGLIGLGAVGKCLLNLLAPFGTSVMIYDPYIPVSALSEWPFAKQVSFEEVLKADVVTVHASQTSETYHIMNEDAFSKMKDGSVFINTSRGSLVDTESAEKMIKAKHLRAAFDVYEHEESHRKELTGIDSVILQPHIAALPAGAKMTEAIIRDINRFLNNENTLLNVSYKQFKLMTKE